MNRFVIRQSLLLLLTAFIWGVAFVAQSAAMDKIGPFTFVGCRNILASCALFVIVLISQNKKKASGEKAAGEQKEEPWYRNKQWFMAALTCGFFLCSASLLQQFSLQSASTAKAGFLTALYIIMVPILGIFFRKKAGILVWIGVGMSLLGVYFLCALDGLGGFKAEDFLLLGCAFLFSWQIMSVDYFVERVDSVLIAFGQFLFTAIVCSVCMLLIEHPTWDNIVAAGIPILYAGLFSSAVAYTLQIVGQKGMNPTVASLIMSLESVFSALAGWAILHQVLSLKEILGCVLVFAAIIVAQIPVNSKKKA